MVLFAIQSNNPWVYFCSWTLQWFILLRDGDIRLTVFLSPTCGILSASTTLPSGTFWTTLAPDLAYNRLFSTYLRSSFGHISTTFCGFRIGSSWTAFHSIKGKLLILHSTRLKRSIHCLTPPNLFVFEGYAKKTLSTFASPETANQNDIPISAKKNCFKIRIKTVTWKNINAYMNSGSGW